MLEFVQAIKNTDFYKEFIDKLYICQETPEIVWFSTKKEYKKMDEIIVGNDLDTFVLAGYNLFDKVCAFSDTDNGITKYELKEIK